MTTRTPHPFLLLVLSLLLAATTAVAQRITVVSVDSSNFPTIRARLFAIDAAGRAMTDLSAGDFTVTEGGARRDVISFHCPAAPSPTAISSVLTVDVSGSMSSAGTDRSAANIELARTAARAWIEGLPPGSECAITSFDDRSLINTDFTADRSQMLAAVNTLRPSGGTNYNAGFNDPLSGGTSIAATGREKHIVVFLTDGLGDASENQIVAAADKANVTLFCVTLGMPAPPVLKNVARRTGGSCYENVTTIEEARGIYQAILYQALGGEPCELVWKTEAICSTDRSATIAVPSHSLSVNTSYTLARTSLPTITLSPAALSFDVVEPGRTKEMRITVTAANRAVTVERIEQVGRNGAFKLNGTTGPFTLTAGESRSFTVSYTAADTNYSFARWMIRADACSGTSIAASAGSGASKAPTIRLLAPNGGERYNAGDPVTLSWDGVLPTDPVRLDYSTDAGSTWRTVADRTSGLSYAWHAPGTPSERCLARVSQLESRNGSDSAANAIALVGHEDYVMSTTFSSDGRRAVTASWDGTARVWDARTGRMLQTLTVSRGANGGRPQRVYYAEFTPDGSRVVTASDGRNISVWDAATGRLLRKLEGRLFQKPDVEGARMDGDVTPDPVISADGARVLARGDREPMILDLASGRTVAVLAGHGDWVEAATFSPDGKLVVTGSRDSTARVWDAATGRLVARYAGHKHYVTSVAFSPDSRFVASAGPDGHVRVWDAGTGEELHSFFVTDDVDVLARIEDTKPRAHGINQPLHNIRAIFSPDGTTLLIWNGVDIAPMLVDVASGQVLRRIHESPTAGRSSVGYMMFSPDGGIVASREAEVQLWDAATAKKLADFPWDMQMSWLAFSPDGSRIAASNNKRSMLWRVDAPIAQSDPSDSLWAIIDSHPLATDVDFGPRAVRTRSDSVVSGFIRNTGGTPMRVETITIGGTNAKEFSLVSGIPPFDVPPGGSRSVEFRFAPSLNGERTATAEITAGGHLLRQRLRGEGIAQEVRLATTSIDFGTVAVGERRDSTVTAIVRNSGRTPVELTNASIIGPDTAQFVITAGGERGTLAPGGTRAVSLRFAARKAGRSSSRLAFGANNGTTLTADLFGRGLGDEEPLEPEVAYNDPTTFRTIAVPNAVLPKAGSIVAGSYDLLGLMAGYVPLDRVMILGGGGVPLPDDWGGVHGTMYGAYSLGLKVGIFDGDKLDVAAGYQWARSIYDREDTRDSLESGITAHTPYAAVSWGDDDSRVSLTAGYAFKTHTTIDAGTFTKNAAIIALGGDYRFAKRWKVAAEGFYMQTLGYAPVAVTARFFGASWAIDAGAAYVGIETDGDAPSLKVAPLVSFVKVW